MARTTIPSPRQLQADPRPSRYQVLRWKRPPGELALHERSIHATPQLDALRTPADAMAFLRDARERQGLSQRRLAATLGIRTSAYLSNLLNGRLSLVNSRYFQPLCDALRVSVAERRQLEQALRRSVRSHDPGRVGINSA